MQKDSYSFWKNVKYVDNAKTPLASKINDCVGETDICKMWQGHYQSILSSVNPIRSGGAFKSPPPPSDFLPSRISFRSYIIVRGYFS